MQSKIQKEELKKRDQEMKEATNDTLKNLNEYTKKVALLEQERDYLRNDVQNLKENLQKREIEDRESQKLIREKEDKIKSLIMVPFLLQVANKVLL